MPKLAATLLSALAISFSIPVSVVYSASGIETALKLIHAGEYEKSFKVLTDGFIATDEIEKERSNYLRGYALLNLQRSDEALKEFSKIKSPLLGDYASLHVAQIQSGEWKYSEVITTANAFFEKYPYSPAGEQMALLKADALKNKKMFKDAATVLKKYLPKKPEKPELFHWEIAQLEEKYGHFTDSYKSYQKIFYKYPHTDLSEPARLETVRMQKKYKKRFPTARAIRKLGRIKILMEKRKYNEVDSYIHSIKLNKIHWNKRAVFLMQHAIASKRLGKKDKSIKILRGVIYNAPKAKIRPEAMYMLAKLHWNKGNNGKTRKVLREIIREYPWHTKAGSAYYVLGIMDENKGDVASSEKNFNKAATSYSKKIVAQDALWRLGWQYYGLNKLEKAQNTFDRFISKYPLSDRLDKILYWQIRTLKREGKPTGNLKETLKEKFPFSYYTMMLPGMPHRPTQLKNGSPNDNHTQIDEIVGRQIKADMVNFNTAPKLTGRLKWVFESSQNWAELGFNERAKPLLDILAGELKPKPDYILWLTSVYYQAGYYDEGLSKLWKFPVSNVSHSLEKKRLLSRFMYPLPYWEAVLNEAKNNSMDPMLVLSIIRQESRFNADVVSSANARGLMQIIPPTGKRISKALKMKNFSDDLLYEPEINIRMGVYYLSGLIKKSNGELAPAIASYNAGSRTVKKWLKRIPYDDVEVFIEKIPYPETRNYVKKVLRNYGMYRELYGGIKPPERASTN